MSAVLFARRWRYVVLGDSAFTLRDCLSTIEAETVHAVPADHVVGTPILRNALTTTRTRAYHHLPSPRSTDIEYCIGPVTNVLTTDRVVSLLTLPGSDFSLLKEYAGPGPEVIVAVYSPIAAPTEEATAVSTGHLVAPAILFDPHLTRHKTFAKQHSPSQRYEGLSLDETHGCHSHRVAVSQRPGIASCCCPPYLTSRAFL
jgi:hypothetical protein